MMRRQGRSRAAHRHHPSLGYPLLPAPCSRITFCPPQISPAAGTRARRAASLEHPRHGQPSAETHAAQHRPAAPLPSAGLGPPSMAADWAATNPQARRGPRLPEQTQAGELSFCHFTLSVSTRGTHLPTGLEGQHPALLGQARSEAPPLAAARGQETELCCQQAPCW